MQSKLWFLADGVSVLSVFDNRHDSERYRERFQDDPDYQDYEVYGIHIDDLEDYPDEYELALSEGYLL